MGEHFDGSWRTISPEVLSLVAMAQLKAAQSSQEYVPALLAETGQSQSGPDINPQAFSGVASDGRPLDTLLYGSVIESGEAYNRGASTATALLAGRQWLDMVVRTQIADAGRVATGVQTAADPDQYGHVRYLNPPSCQRCAVLAGRIYRYSTGFDRHPQCDCVMVPVRDRGWAEAEGFVTDATKNLDDIKDLTRGQRAALEDGADLSQVVGAKRLRSVKPAGELLGKGAADAQRRLYGSELTFTTSGTTRHGMFGHRERLRGGGFDRRPEELATRYTRSGPELRRVRRARTQVARPTPESIYKVAKDRDDAIRLLKRFAYIY